MERPRRGMFPASRMDTAYEPYPSTTLVRAGSSNVGAAGTYQHTVRRDRAYGGCSPDRHGEWPLQYSEHRRVPVALDGLFVDELAGRQGRRSPISVQPA